MLPKPGPVYSWHTKGLTVPLKSGIEQCGSSQNIWNIARDVHIEPEEFQKGEWVQQARAEVIRPSSAELMLRAMSASRTRQTTLWYVKEYKTKMQEVDVVEDYESKPR